MKEERKVRKFKLIDKEGYLERFPVNSEMLDLIYSGVLEGTLTEDGCLFTKTCLVTSSELQFFEEVTNKQETSHCTEKPTPEKSLYWQGGQPLKAGLIVGKNCSGGREFFVKYVGDTYAVLADKRGEYTSTISNLKSVVKSDKDVIFEKVLSVWKRQSLDNAHDGKDSIVHLESFFDTVYHVIKGES